MAVADPYPAGLDPAHIVAVCEYATGGRHALAIGTGDGICVCLPARQAAHHSLTALTRVGYRAAEAPGNHGRDIMVRGWDATGLQSRLTAMRTVLHQLDSDHGIAARAALTDRLSDLPAADRAVPELVDRARERIRYWVFARSGVHAPRNTAIEPADVAIALRLRATVTLEQAIGELIQRQLRVAGHAAALYGSLVQQMSTVQARDTAIRWASITFYLGSSPAQDSSALIRAALRDRGPRPPAQPQAFSQRAETRPDRQPGLRLRATGSGPAPDAGGAPVIPFQRLPRASRPRRAH